MTTLLALLRKTATEDVDAIRDDRRKSELLHTIIPSSGMDVIYHEGEHSAAMRLDWYGSELRLQRDGQTLAMAGTGAAWAELVTGIAPSLGLQQMEVS